MCECSFKVDLDTATLCFNLLRDAVTETQTIITEILHLCVYPERQQVQFFTVLVAFRCSTVFQTVLHRKQVAMLPSSGEFKIVNEKITKNNNEV